MKFKVYDCCNCIGKEIEFDELAARITACNLCENMELESVKALVVMAKTELARKSNFYGGKGCNIHEGYDICTNPGHCLQCKIRKVKIPEIVFRAMEETKNKIITFADKPVKPYFHYKCGGATENSENVIGQKITYLRRVLCSYCNKDNKIDCEKSFDINQLETLLGIRLIKNSEDFSIIKGVFDAIERDDEGRVKSIKIGNKLFEGTEVMKKLELSSTRFNYTPVKFIFNSIGDGHGLGLCQSGSIEMARLGYNYEEILKYYYTGIEIKEIKAPENEKPLQGKKFVIDGGSGEENHKSTNSLIGINARDINLEIATELEKLLKESGAEVILTRKDRKNIPLCDRALIANENKPDFFISILQNSFPSSGVSGTEVYHYRGDEDSEKMSINILDEICNKLGTKNRGVKNAEYYLLRQIRSSAIIIQLLYITNPQDRLKLEDKEFVKKAAKAIYNGIGRFYNINIKVGI